MLYVQGDLSEQECVDIEAFAKQFEIARADPINYQVVCQDFIDSVKSTFNIVRQPEKFCVKVKPTKQEVA